MAAGFPKIIRFRGVTEGMTTCPHCGATGRYVWYFQVEDGRELGAMRGCVRLFPVSRIAHEHQRLTMKALKNEKLGWKLGSNDSAALDAIEQFYDGQLTEAQALAVVDGAKARNTARYRRGRR